MPGTVLHQLAPYRAKLPLGFFARLVVYPEQGRVQVKDTLPAWLEAPFFVVRYNILNGVR